MKRLTFQQLCDYANQFFQKYPNCRQFSKDAPKAVIVFKQESFDQEYTELSRSYQFSLANKFFMPDQGGNSIFADCLDGSEYSIRLDWYIRSWKIDYCYLLNTTNK